MSWKMRPSLAAALAKRSATPAAVSSRAAVARSITASALAKKIREIGASPAHLTLVKMEEA